jgi:predicted dehydrogenase
MVEKLRIGLVGTSWYADILLLPLLINQPRAVLSAICGRNAERATEMANKFNVSQTFTDYRAMIDSNTVDAVVVAAPDDVHYAITMYALDAGKHVLCEKPLASNASQAREMYEKASAANLKHLVMFSYQWSPHYHLLRQLVKDGYMGNCFQANFHYLGDYGRRWISGWRFDRKRGNGALGDLGSHMIQLARWLVGEIVSVSAQLSATVPRVGDDGQRIEASNDTATLMIEFADGARGVIHVSAVSYMGDRGQLQQVALYGDAGTLEAKSSGNTEMVEGIHSEATAFEVLPIPADLAGFTNSAQAAQDNTEPLREQAAGCRAFIDAVLDDKSAYPNFYDGWRVQQVIDAALESNETGCRVSIP